MDNSQLQHLGTLLTGGEESALLAREIMIGQGIWNAQGLCDCLNAVEPVALDDWPRHLSIQEWGIIVFTDEERGHYLSSPNVILSSSFRPLSSAEIYEAKAGMARLMNQFQYVNLA